MGSNAPQMSAQNSTTLSPNTTTGANNYDFNSHRISKGPSNALGGPGAAPGSQYRGPLSPLIGQDQELVDGTSGFDAGGGLPSRQ